MTDTRDRAHTIGAYPIEREVGRGGMGIVYLARDPRLDRPVAIKVLPDAFAADPERLARFEREARLLASLSHPNIAAIHGLEEAEGRRFLVLEYVEGETLAQRLARGPLPVDETIEVGRQIAAALEAAHEAGIVHRDLKPGNVKLTPSGDVKVLDFGLAKGGTATTASSDPSLSASPTMSYAATSAGVILGTAAYMSPEQARGRAVDRRTDIWSFGCVVYECLTGRQAFAGETVSDMIALILQGEPDWKALPAATPPRLRELLARCLTKDPKKRLRDIGEARLLLEGGDVPHSSGAFASLPVTTTARRGPGLAALLASVFALATVVLAVLLAARSPAPQPLRRVSLAVPPMSFPPRDPGLAWLSPDGTKIVTTTADSAGTTRLWFRALDHLEGRLLPGTEDASYVAWSPEGEALLFSTQDKVKKLQLSGGAPEAIGPIRSYGRGLSWGTRGVIVYSGGPEGPIYRMSAEGGEATQATTLGPGETGHRFPLFLPDGRHFLYAAMPGHGTSFDIWIASTDDAKAKQKLLEADGVPRYVEPGWLLFARNGRVMAQKFDAGSRRLSGKPIALSDELKQSTYLGSSSVVAGERGPFAYFTPDPAVSQLAWTTFSGDRELLPIAPGSYTFASVSPIGDLAALVRSAGQSESDVWLLDLERMAVTRFTFGPGRVDRPIWSRDGKQIAFANSRSGRWDVFVKAVGETGSGHAVLESGSAIKYPDAWTPDGKTLLVEQIDEKTGWDIFALPLEAGGKPRPLFASSFDENFAAVSDDGRWVAYCSNESGRSEVYVDAYPATGHRSQISTTGGAIPFWRPDGREIAFLTSSAVSRVSFDPVAGRVVGAQRNSPLGDASAIGFMPDFRRALMLAPVQAARVSDDLTLVDGWRSELKPR